MCWTHDGDHVLAGDEGGCILYWTSYVSPDSKIQAHEEKVGVTSISMSPTDSKFVTAGEDGGVRVFDFWSQELEVAFPGHTSASKSVSWHSYMGLIASGGQDNMVRLWDPRDRSGKEGGLRVLAGHTGWVTEVSWNSNGWWLASGSRDNTTRLWDIRSLGQGQGTGSSLGGTAKGEPFRVWTQEGKGISSLTWHPHSERLLVTGGMTGSMHTWHVDHAYPQALVPRAHDMLINALVYHPSGSILVTMSEDHTAKFWARSRPGDTSLQYAYQGNQVKRALEQAQMGMPQQPGGPLDYLNDNMVPVGPNLRDAPPPVPVSKGIDVKELLAHQAEGAKSYQQIALEQALAEAARALASNQAGVKRKLGVEGGEEFDDEEAPPGAEDEGPPGADGMQGSGWAPGGEGGMPRAPTEPRQQFVLEKGMTQDRIPEKLRTMPPQGYVCRICNTPGTCPSCARHAPRCMCCHSTHSRHSPSLQDTGSKIALSAGMMRALV